MAGLLSIVDIRRHLQDLPVADAARGTGLCRQTIYNVRDGKENITLETLCKLSVYVIRRYPDLYGFGREAR